MTRISTIYSRGATPRSEAQVISDTFEARRRAWQELGLAVIEPTDVADDWLRQAIVNEAIRKFGERGR